MCVCGFYFCACRLFYFAFVFVFVFNCCFTDTECVNSTLSSDDFSLTLDESKNDDACFFTITAPTNYEISGNAKSYMKLGIQFNDNFEENRTNVGVLLADESRYTGLHLTLDEIEFTNDCGSDTLEYFDNDTNNSIIIPTINDLTWYPHSSVIFRDSNVVSANEIDIEYYFDPLQETSLFKTFAFVQQIHSGGVIVDSECGWYGNYKENRDLSVYILATCTNDSYTSTTSLIEEINIEYCADNTNMFTTTREPQTIFTELKSLSGNINITTLSKSCDDNVFNFTCLNCFNSIEVTDEGEIYFGGFSTTLVNSEYGCACPVGVINNSLSSEEIVMIELNDGTNVYGKKTYLANSSDAIVSISIGEIESNCTLNYYVNYASFANVSALNWLQSTFGIQNTIDLNTTQIEQLEYQYSNYFANVFNVSQNSSVVTTNKTVIADQSDETRRRRRRSRSLLQDSEWQYLSEVTIEANTADDASGFDLSDHFADLLSIFCAVANDDECFYNNISTTNNDAASPYFNNITQEIGSSESSFASSNEEFDTTTTTVETTATKTTTTQTYMSISTTDENDNGTVRTNGNELDISILILLILLLFCCILACIWGVYRKKDKKKELKEEKKIEMIDVHKRFEEKNLQMIASGSATPQDIDASVDGTQIDFTKEEDELQGAPNTIVTTSGRKKIHVLTYENYGATAGVKNSTGDDGSNINMTQKDGKNGALQNETENTFTVTVTDYNFSDQKANGTDSDGDENITTGGPNSSLLHHD